MAVKNIHINFSQEIIPKDQNSAREHIKLLGFWLDISNDANVSFRWGKDGEDFFPKTRSGLVLMNLVGFGNAILSPENASLWINIEGDTTVRGTIIYEYY